jgi:hypothetical protein
VVGRNVLDALNDEYAMYSKRFTCLTMGCVSVGM